MSDPVDLLEVEVICKEILSVEDNGQITGKQLRQKIAQKLNINEEMLSKDEVKEHIDNVALEILSKSTAMVASNIENLSATKINEKRKTAQKDPAKPSKRSKTMGTTKSSKESTIERLKGYVVKCGVRKQWKKEFEGLSQKQMVSKLEQMLRELGMEGRPSLEKCKAIKERREFEEERKALDPNNVLPTRLRRDTTHPTDMKNDSPSVEINPNRNKLNLALLGDPESE